MSVVNVPAFMQVLVITPFLWSGAGKAIVRLILELRSRGFDFELISSGRSRGQSDWPEYVKLLREAGIPYHTIDFFDRTPERFWNSVNELTHRMESKRIDLVHVHAGVPALAAGIVRDRLRARFPVVATFHSWNPDRPEWMNHADVWALNRCDLVVTDSQSYRKLLADWGLDVTKSRTIRLGVDIPPERRAPATPGEFRILSVGRLEPRKDQETLLHGFALFRKQFPKADLCLAGPPGDQSYCEQLMRKAARFGWDRGVHFLGKVRDLDALYRRADLYVSTSRDEGLGLALLEAMSYGLPVLCTPVAGHLDFVEDGRNARLIPVGDWKCLAQSMLELRRCAEVRDRLGQGARQTIEAGFSWTRTVEEYAGLFRQIMSRIQV